ncbi:GumC family protein [Sphingomicrobium sediminis]|uniref:Polysaccharide biosynthesis tyrosine autokinase n=1 Tax=Sphingomicrobium sediminis TaxID=2950949 RepID=A0A9X2J1E4_9SPHN|nr:polysaccharide biosynthesis tyrosine autokinase [Sphingomicrobium sediminis]MCM8556644.1 polysaccharide biosynthesis tyrosine autokinase [Sphingomicrobium sediminis]
MAQDQNPLPVPSGPGGDHPLPAQFLEQTQPQPVGFGPTSFVSYVWKLVWRWKWLILAITSVSIVIAILLAMLAPREYSATTRIEILRTTSNLADIGDIETDVNIFDYEFYQTQYELLRSRTLAEKVVEDLDLANDLEFLAGYDPETVENVADFDGDTRFERATAIVQGGTAISPILDSSIVDLVITSGDPEMSAAIANSLATNYRQSNLDRRYESTDYARSFLAERLEASREALEASEAKVAEYAREQGLIRMNGGRAGSGQETLAETRLRELSNRLAQATATRVTAEADFRANSGGRAATTSLDNDTLQILRNRRSDLRAELSKLESDFGPEYPAVKALQAQIADVDNSIAIEESRVTSSVNRDLEDRYRQSLAAENRLRGQVDSLTANLLDQQSRSVGVNVLEREVDTNRSIYEALLSRYQEIGVASGIGNNNISIVDEATVPGGPSSPNIPLYLVMGLIFGLSLSGGTVAVLAKVADGGMTPADVEAKLGLPLHGATPMVGTDEIDIGMEDQRSALAEAYYSILTTLKFATHKGLPKSMLLTSSRPSEGKSISARALATHLAMLGQKVLLIDGDMRKPTLGRLLDGQDRKGLAEWLKEEATHVEIFFEPTDTGFSVVFSGDSPPNPVELLSGPRLGELVKLASEHFDHVIIDGPPVMGLADAQLLARATQKTVFVVESETTRTEMARSALRRLKHVGAQISGVIMTKVPSHSAGYGYGYYDYVYKPLPKRGVQKILTKISGR